MQQESQRGEEGGGEEEEERSWAGLCHVEVEKKGGGGVVRVEYERRQQRFKFLLQLSTRAWAWPSSYSWHPSWAPLITVESSGCSNKLCPSFPLRKNSDKHTRNKHKEAHTEQMFKNVNNRVKKNITESQY